MIRAITEADLAAVAELVRRVETALFGAPEQDAAEIADRVREAEPLAARSRLAEEDGQVRGAAWSSRTDAELAVDPDLEPLAVLAELLSWLEQLPAPELGVLSCDVALLDTLQERGWRHERSSFELFRDVSNDWQPAQPDWPDDVEVRAPQEEDLPDVHRLLYVDARWADVPGHHERPYEEWRRLFLAGVPLDLQVVALRNRRPVGVALNRVFADGTGWVSQLAVARDDRGRGLGRALLLESLQRLRTAGAAVLGLDVQGSNDTALGLYLSVGLQVRREFRHFVPPPAV
jgi:ribosomal protein S18 acetylase RimI-like enzyme